MSRSRSQWPLNPRTIPGLALWLDATDVNGNGTIPTNGSTVSTWADKSGNNRNLSAVSGTTSYSTYEGRASLQQVSGAYMTGLSGVDLTQYTFFIVALSQTSVDNQVVFTAIPTSGYGYNSTSGFGFYIDTNTVLRSRFYGGTNANTVLDSATAATDRYPLRITSYTCTSSGTLNSYINGSTGSTVSTSYTRTSGCLGFTLGADYYNGSFSLATSVANTSEVIVYNTVLSTTQRQAVEGYLAKKWGFASSATTPVLYAPTSPVYSGLSLWLDAADKSTVTFSSGSNISTVTDKSGSGNNSSGGGSGSTVTYVTNAINGLPAFSFDGNSWLVGNFAGANTGSQFHAFAVAVMSSSITASYARILSLGTSGGGDNLSNTAIAMTRWNGGLTMGTARNNVFISNTIPAYSTPFLVQTNQSSSTGVVGINGALAPVSGTTGASGNFNIPSYAVGASVYTTDPQRWYGFIGEVIYFTGVLTSQQQQQIEGYLAAKWGLLSSLPSTHPYYSQKLPITHPYYRFPPYARVFAPNDLPGCALWLDAADKSTVTISSGSNISVWADKSGNGYNASNSVGTTTYSSVSNAVVFTGTQLLKTNLTYSSLNTSTYFIVGLTTSSAAGGQDMLSVYGVGTSAGYQIVLGALKPNMYLYGGALVLTSSSSLSVNTPFLLGGSYNGTSTAYMYINGTQAASGSGPANLAGNGNVALGGYYDTQLGEPLSGNIYEVIVFSNVLSTTQRQQVEGYLAWKWGISKSSIAPLYAPVSPIFNGLALWLDAADPSGNGKLPANGTSIAAWFDKSGNGRNLLQNGGSNIPTYKTSLATNGLPGLDFTNSSGLISSSFQKSSNATLLLVGMVKSSIGGWGTFWGHFESGRHDADIQLRNTSGQAVINWHTNNDNANTQLSYTLDSMALYSCTMSNGNVMFIQQTNSAGTSSVSYTEGTTTITTTNNAPVWVGRSDANECINSYIYEIVYYQQVLSSTQRQQVEGYLAAKWGLSSSLPTTHPYYSGTLPITHPYYSLPANTYVPPVYSDVTAGRWKTDFSAELTFLSNANSAATRSFSTFGAGSGYYGGVLAPNGLIYCAPISAGNVGVIIPSSSSPFATWATIGSGLGTYYGGVLAPNGNIYLSPNGSGTVAVIVPSSTSPYGTVSTLGSGLGAYTGGALGPDGKIYFVSENGNSNILVLTPADTSPYGSLSTISRTGTSYFFGAVLGTSGNIYAIPSGESNVGIINPFTQTYTSGASATGYQGGVLGVDGKIYMFKDGSVGIYNPITNTVTTGGSSTVTGMKSGCYGPDGNIYMNPILGSNLSVYKPSTNTTSNVYTPGGFQYMGGVLAPNGCVYFIPWGASSGLVMSFTGLKATPSLGLCLSGFMNKL